MGGTQGIIDTHKQYSKLSNELDQVNFYMIFSGNLSMLDIEKLHDRIGAEIGKKLTQNGIVRHKIYGVGGGGGGVEGVWEIIKTLWENRDIMIFVSSLRFFLKRTYARYLNNSVSNLYPRVLVHFNIESESSVNKIEKKDLCSVTYMKLSNLLCITNHILNELKSSYNAFFFDLSVELKINSIGYSSTYSLCHELRKSREKRMLKIIKNLKVIPNLNSTYDALNFNFVRRSDKGLDTDGNLHFKDYYFFFSTNTLSDFLK